MRHYFYLTGTKFILALITYKNNKNAKEGFVYASVQTPEIDYGSLSPKEKNSIIIAGVPTLLKIKNKKIIDFYFDSVEIKPLLKSLNND